MIKAIAIVIVMLVVNVLMFFSIRRAALRVDYTLRRLFMQKISIEQTEEETVSSSGEEMMKDRRAEEPPQVVVRNVIISASDTLKPVSFKSSSLKDDYRAIKQISEFTPERSLDYTKSRLDASDMSVRRDYEGLLKNLSADVVYELASLEPDQQEAVLRESLSPEQICIIDDYLAENRKRFDSIDFYSYVKQMNEICGSEFIVRTGNKEDDDRVLPDGTRLKYDDGICEGSQVIYGNKLYDYSI